MLTNDPRLRTAERWSPPYRLNCFPEGTALAIGREIVYLLFTRGEARLEGSDWERIFADAIGARWEPSNVGLDDIKRDGCCWGAKTVKNANPHKASRVRLISGRNSLDYSFGDSDPRAMPVDTVGAKVLGIWNARVTDIRARYGHARTVVLVKSETLAECIVFEAELVKFEHVDYTWNWNNRGNLQGIDRQGVLRFTWQPSGSQFTIHEDVPPRRLAFRLRTPQAADKDQLLTAIGFDPSWVEIVK
ncbi:MAG: hypothetical protein NT029_00585 [Armatimonadetes bacterium]|nr:hypothetical protein [Armatimonadota bacterium]